MDAARLYEDGLARLTQGATREARTLLEKAQALAPEDPKIAHALARAVDAAGDAAAARPLFERAHALDAEAPDPACDLAMLHLAAEEEAQAERVLAPALRRHPDDPRLNLHMAMALAKTSAGRAREHAGRAIEARDPEIREQARALYSVLAAHSG